MAIAEPDGSLVTEPYRIGKHGASNVNDRLSKITLCSNPMKASGGTLLAFRPLHHSSGPEMGLDCEPQELIGVPMCDLGERLRVDRKLFEERSATFQGPPWIVHGVGPVFTGLVEDVRAVFADAGGACIIRTMEAERMGANGAPRSVEA
jgi:hypothetical protein